MRGSGAAAAAASILACAAVLAGDAAKAGAQDEQPGAIERVNAPPKPAALAQTIRFQIVDREKGLPQNSVSSIAQDKKGFMWLGTQDGLARYDGQRFVVFRHDPEDPSSLSHSFVSELLVGKDGTLWVGTDGGGLNRFNSARSSFSPVKGPDGSPSLADASVMSMSEAPDGTLWIGTNGAGLIAFTPATGNVRVFSLEDGIQPVLPAVLAGDTGVWIGSVQGLFFRGYKETGFERLFSGDEQMTSLIVTALARDEKGDIWIGTAGDGVIRYNPTSKKRTQYKNKPGDPTSLNDDTVTSIYADRAGRIWVTTEEALHLVDADGGTFDRHLPNAADSRSLPVQPREVYQDSAGVIWVGTQTGGAALLDPRAFNFKFFKTHAAGRFMFRGDDLWVTTFDGVCRFRKLADGVCYPAISAVSLLVDRHGGVWAGTVEEGLYRMDPAEPNTWIHYQDGTVPGSLTPGFVVELYEDRAGNIWIGTLGGGLQRYDRKSQQFISYQLPSGVVYTVKEDPSADGILWIGTGDSGLVRLDTASGEIKAFIPSTDERQKKTDNAVIDFLFDGGAVWLATYGGGLKRLDLKTANFKSYRRAEGLPSNTLYSIQKDKTGKLWLSSIAGLARFDPKSEKVNVFTSADGLQSDEFTLKSGAATPDGRLAFGGSNGFNVFRPEQIQIDSTPPPMVVTAIRVFGEPYDTDQAVDSISHIDLGYDETTVSVEFAALSYSGSNRIAFDYKLGDGKWLSTDSAVVSLAGLDDGDYSLHLRARNRHGVESAPRSIALTVAPPPWRTWWAYLGYGVVLLALVFSIYRYQQVRIERLQKLARLATVEREFEVTAAVQSWFLPEASAFSTGYTDLVGFYRGAEKCSGDWWWYEDLGHGRLWVIVADVTGHGAGPAMLTAAVAMGLSVQSATAQEPVTQRLLRVNREVLVRCKGKATMTMTACVLDQTTGHAVVYGLGGLPALVMGPAGKHAILAPSGTPIGAGENLSIGERSIDLTPGDRLLITTDGIVEATLATGKPLGFRRFVNVMRDVRALPLDQAVNRIVLDVDGARGKQVQEDDFTFCMLERRT